MSEKELIAKMDAALAHVDPDRRKFLGILLAGVAAAPLLTSASLAAEDKAHFPKTEAGQKANTGAKPMVTQKGRENATWIKGGAPVNSNQTLKNNSGIKNDAALKNNNSTIKSSSGALKNNSALKNSGGANTQLKFDGVNNNKANTSALKNSSGATKLDANANSSKIK